MLTRKDNWFLTIIGMAAFVASIAQWGALALMAIGGFSLLIGDYGNTPLVLLAFSLLGYLVSVLCYGLLARVASYYVTRITNREKTRR